jgi:GxxExxY protein
MSEEKVIHRRGAELAEFSQSELSGKILAAAFEVHTHLGPGLLESAYQRALAHELGLQGVPFASQVNVPLHYKGEALDAPLRLNLLVDGKIVVEVKSVTALEDIHRAQLLTYLRLSGLQAGLLINFNVPSLKLGIKRVINTLRTSANSAPLR